MKRTAALVVFGVILCSGLFFGVLWAPSGGYGAGGYHGGGYHGGGYYGYRGYYGGWHGGYYGPYGFGLGWGYPYAYPYYAPYYSNPYPYPYAQQYPAYPSADTQLPVPSEPQQSYWYYCQNPEGYYPYVRNCPGGWTQVVPTPPQSGQERGAP